MATLYDAIKPKSDQLNADDLKFKEKIIKITDVKVKSGEQPVSVFFEGDEGKPWKPCKTMISIMMKIWGDDEYGRTWIGHSVKLYRDPKVDFGNNKGIGGIRFQEASGIQKVVNVPYTVSKARTAAWTVKPLGDVIPVEMPEEDYLDILSDVQNTENKEALIALNIAQYKDKLSQKQSTQLREAYKAQLLQIKNEEIPV